MIKQAVGTEPRLVKGGGGIFDVTVDGKLVFSKNHDRGFPAQDEVVKAVQSLAEPKS